MGRKKVILIFGFVCIFGLLSAQPGSAAIYKYIDRDGMLNFADDLQSIPAEYRASVKIAGTETETNGPSVSSKAEPQKPAPPAEPGPSVTPAPSTAVTQPERVSAAPVSFGRKLLISIIITVSALFAFVILKILDTDHKKSVAVVRIVILWGMTVCLLYAHTGDVVRLFKKADNELTAAQQQSAEKGKKAIKAMKAMNELVEQAGQTIAEPAGSDGEKKE
jgi:hypothetical protein